MKIIQGADGQLHVRITLDTPAGQMQTDVPLADVVAQAHGSDVNRIMSEQGKTSTTDFTWNLKYPRPEINRVSHAKYRGTYPPQEKQTLMQGNIREIWHLESYEAVSNTEGVALYKKVKVIPPPTMESLQAKARVTAQVEAAREYQTQMRQAGLDPSIGYGATNNGVPTLPAEPPVSNNPAAGAYEPVARLPIEPATQQNPFAMPLHGAPGGRPIR
jgi:hypothetical protein